MVRTGESAIGDRRLRNIFLSPIPPINSGTADYFEAFLKEIGPDRLQSQSLIVCDLEFLGSAAARQFLDIPVVHYWEYVQRPDDRVFVFLANNQFHYYCFKFLNKPHIEGRIVSILHDPQVCGNLSGLCTLPEYGFTEDNLRDILEDELGIYTSHFLEMRRVLPVPEFLNWTTVAQALAIRHSTEIWVHSYYAAVKILLEHGNPAAFPPIRVMQFPRESRPLHAGGARKKTYSEKFTVGIFGFIGPLKRITQVIEAFGSWRRTLPLAEQGLARLLIVGQPPPTWYYDPKDYATSRGLGDCVEFMGFVDLQRFEELLRECSLVFNLRFPSCGETSATLQHARDLRIPVAASSYAAFYEEPADFKCSVHPDREPGEILAILAECWRAWRSFGTTQTLSQSITGVHGKMKAREIFDLYCGSQNDRGTERG